MMVVIVTVADVVVEIYAAVAIVPIIAAVDVDIVVAAEIVAVMHFHCAVAVEIVVFDCVYVWNVAVTAAAVVVAAAA